MATTIKRVTAALEQENLRQYVDAIEQNGDEVVLWAGNGHPVTSVKDALAFARDIRDDVCDDKRTTRAEDSHARHQIALVKSF